MCCENEGELNEKLRQFVYDEDRIVTVVWLSNKLNITTDKCKSLLDRFVANERKLKADNLGVTYILSGKLCDKDVNSIIVVEENDVTQKKETFQKISSEFIYSVQNSKNVELNCVNMIDMLNLNDPVEKPVLGSIIGKNCVKRILKEKKALPTVIRAPPTDKGKASHLFDASSVKSETSKSVKDKETEVKQEVKESKTSVKAKSVKPSTQKAGIASFFSRVPSKTEIKTEIKEEINDQNNIKAEVKKEEPKEEECMEVDVTPKEEEKVKDKMLYDSGTDEEAKKVEETNKRKKSTPKTKKPSKRQKKDKTSEQASKRRKRIVQQNDSDSDDIFGDENNTEEPSVIEDSDDEPVYKKPATPVLAPKNKKRKLVDKTYTDEEGYLVTKQEWVYDSASDDDEEEGKEQKNPQIEKKAVPVKEKEKKSTSSQESTPPKTIKGKKGIKPPTNQPTLMSFFKKK